MIRPGPSSARGGYGAKIAAHPWEQASLDLASFMHDTPPGLAEALRVGGKAPWQATLPKADVLNYYAQVLAGNGPPGELNEAALAQRIGDVRVAEIRQILEREHAKLVGQGA